MSYENIYLYCIIEEPSFRSFGSLGISRRGDEVHTLSYKDLSCVISSVPMAELQINRSNMLSHQKVIEEVIKNYTALPVRFGTIASSVEEVRSLMMKRYYEFKNLLRAMDNKVEMGLKAFWLDLNRVFNEIAKADHNLNKLINNLKKKKNISLDESISVGEEVKKALDEKRENEVQKIILPLKSQSVDYVKNDILRDIMILNYAFLIDKRQEPGFDDLVTVLSEKYKNRFKFKYIGPSPPYNFVNIFIKWGSIKEDRN